MIWRHIDFYFKSLYKDSGKYLNPKEQIMFENCLANIIMEIRPLIKRKFYLYEPIPHCFLACEVKNRQNFKKIILIAKKYAKSLNFIKSVSLNCKSDTGDQGNGEDFLIILNAFTEAYLFNRKSKLTHIVHCCMEFIHQTRERELFFYQKMLALYGGEEYR